MILAILLSIMAGAFGVWQAGFNKVIGESLGMSASLLFNGVFFLVFNLVFFLWVWFRPESFPSDFTIRFALNEMKWWWVLPGLMGFCLVMGLAVSVGRIGAVQTIVISIAAQVFASLVWDLYHGDFQVNQWRLVGAGLALVGAVIATLA